MPKELRTHQRAAVDEAIGAVMFGAEEVIIDAPTSFGKSLVAATLSNELDGKVVILVNITPLIDQIAEEFDEIGVEYSILKAGRESEFNQNARILIAMSQTLHARIDKVNVRADYVIQDEVHREFDTNRTKDVMAKLKPKARIGMTATPYNRAGMALTKHDKPIELVSTIDVKSLTDNGFLTPVRTYVAKFAQKVNYDGIDISSTGDYTDNDVASIVDNDEYNKETVEAWLSIMGEAENKKTAIFVSTIAHCESMSKMFVENGIEARPYHSQLNKDMRDKTMDWFKNGDLDVLVSVNTLSTGWSFTNLRCVVACRKTASRIMFTQILGRLIRTHEGKEEGIFIDLAQWTSDFGFHDEPFNPHRDKKEKKAYEEKEQLHHMTDYVMDTTDEPIIEMHIEKLVEAKREISKDNSIDGLKAKFDYAVHPSDYIGIGAKIFEAITGRPIKNKTIAWIVEGYEEAVMFEDEYVLSRLRKAFKTRTKNIIKAWASNQERKSKFESLRYFPQWFLENMDRSF